MSRRAKGAPAHPPVIVHGVRLCVRAPPRRLAQQHLQLVGREDRTHARPRPPPAAGCVFRRLSAALHTLPLPVRRWVVPHPFGRGVCGADHACGPPVDRQTRTRHLEAGRCISAGRLR